MPDSSGHPLLGLVPAVDDVAWTFRDGGVVVEWNWKAGQPDARSLEPVRTPSSGARSKHIPVRAFSATTGSHLMLESGLEHDLLRALDRDPDVRWLVAQPVRLTWPPAGSKRGQHVPDLLSVDSGEQVTVWDVRRPEAAETDDFLKVRSVTEAACLEVGWRYEVFTGLSGVHRHNLLWLHAYRARPEWASRWEAELLAEAVGGASLSELVGGDPARRATAWHLIWAARLHTDLSKRLAPTSTVSVA